jgi:hypothetical protein
MLARMKKKEHVRTKEIKKSKIDKKDDIIVVPFFLFYFLDYIVRPSKKTPGAGLLWKFSTFSRGNKVPSIKKRNQSQ